jgi:hypothetical protein
MMRISRCARGGRAPLSALIGTALLLSLAACSKPAPPRQKWNVVLISLDTLRADRMSLYGAARRTTPAIDALANDGVSFTRAFSTSPWTLPAHASMLTGRYPSSLSPNASDPLYQLAPMLSTLLKQHGYRTAAVTGGGFVSKAFGADIGFDSFDQRNWDMDRSRGDARPGNVNQAVKFIESSSEPFFLFFHTYIAHVPYSDRRFVHDGDGGRLADLYKGKMTGWMDLNMSLNCGRIDLTEPEKEFLLALYDGGVAAADEMVGDLVEALRLRHVLEKTIIIITSDHGEEFWDHTNRAALHGHTLYNELLRVPMVWYGPGLAKPGSSQPAAVGLIDIVPTVLTQVGAAAPTGIDGVDLSPLLEGRKWNAGAGRGLFTEAVLHGPPRHGVVAGEGTLIVTPDPDVQKGVLCPVPVLDRRELYLPGDLAEKVNRVSEQTDVADTLEHDLRAHEIDAAPPPASVTRAPLDDETRERLRALGYKE